MEIYSSSHFRIPHSDFRISLGATTPFATLRACHTGAEPALAGKCRVATIAVVP
jgi:hypothetical protein